MEIIEEVITCANILPQRTEIKDKIYIRAYNELEQYLMSLFVYYTRKVDITKAKGKLKSWGWTKYLRQLNADSNIKTVRQYPVESGFGDTCYRGITQLIRVPPLQGGCRGFESLYLYH